MLFLFYLLAVAVAFHPVKDFRVKDLHGPKPFAGVKHDVNPQLAMLPSSTVAVSTTDSLASSAPTIELSKDVQMVSTDKSNSIYYLNSRIIDEATGYNESFQLLLDTGSSITWVYNQSCSSDACKQENIEKFDDFENPLTIDDDFHLSYSGQTVTGDLINGDTNHINMTFDDVSITNFTFGLASSVPELFDGFNVSGILGIPSSNNKTVERNLIHQLDYNSVIDKQIFGLSLVSSSQTVKYVDLDSNLLTLPETYGGLMILGSKALDYKDNFIDKDSKVFYAPILANSNDYWLLSMKNITTTGVDGDVQSLNSSGSNSRETIIDTGTTGFVLPLKDADALHKQLFGDDLITDKKGNYAFPCDADSAKFSVSVNGHSFDVSVDDFKGKEYTTDSLQGQCASMIQGLDSEYWVFGAAFLSKFYTVFDLDNGQIGFGDARINSYTLQEVGDEEVESAYNGFRVSNSTTSMSSMSMTSMSMTSIEASSTGGSNSSSSASARSSSDSDSDNSGAGLQLSGVSLLVALVLCMI